MKANVTFCILTMVVVAIFAVPVAFKFDRFPFSNYGMYATAEYWPKNIVYLCGPNGQRFARPFAPLSAGAVFRFSLRHRRLHTDQNENPYLDEVRDTLRSQGRNRLAQFKFVFRPLNRIRYRELVLQRVSQEEIYEMHEFNPCRGNDHLEGGEASARGAVLAYSYDRILGNDRGTSEF